MPKLDIEILKKKYPFETIEKHFENIENMGYKVVASEDQCLIWDGKTLLIDADFYDDYHSNAADAIHGFFFEN